MPLTDDYPVEFEKLWREYPKYPAGRSKKKPSFDAYARANRKLKFTPEDIDTILQDIRERKRLCTTWQASSKFGPPMMATYFNQRMWNEPYEKIRSRMPARPHPSQPSTEPAAKPADPAKVRRHLDQLKQDLGIRGRPGPGGVC